MITLIVDQPFTRLVKYDVPEERDAALTLLCDPCGAHPLTIDLHAGFRPGDPMRQPGFVGFHDAHGEAQ